jgi:glycosyltransferase involved in cell wall biosynthesis
MVDTAFFSPDVTPTPRSRPLVCAAGLEFRDYATMLEAVRGIDADVVLAAASPWSKRRSGLDDAELPANVEVVRLDLHALRQLYADAAVVVMPLVDVDFQAGVTTILEAMSMAKPVVCTRTAGQTDVIVDGVTGVYVAPGDPAALRAAITRLLDDPSTGDALGRAAREWVVEHADVSVYATLLAGVVDRHRPASSKAPT